MKIYLVGGAVRDALLGLAIKERDWVVVGATAEELLKKGYQQVGRDFPVFLHPKTKEEYALARLERKQSPGYHGFHCQFGPEVTLEEDLKRRDLTINAIAMDEDQKIIDPYQGVYDLRHRILRHVSPAFVEDPVRVLRIARFLTRFDAFEFKIAEETLELMKRMVKKGELAHLVPERVWQEFEKALNEQCPALFLWVLDQCGALDVVMPEFKQAMSRNARQEGTARTRFATLCLDLTVSALDSFSKRLKVPRAYQDLARLCMTHCDIISTLGQQSPEAVMSCLEQVDLLRRPERFYEVLYVCETKHQSRKVTDRWKKLVSLYCSVSVTDHERELTSGLKIGESLRRRRKDLVTQQLNEWI